MAKKVETRNVKDILFTSPQTDPPAENSAEPTLVNGLPARPLGSEAQRQEILDGLVRSHIIPPPALPPGPGENEFRSIFRPLASVKKPRRRKWNEQHGHERGTYYLTTDIYLFIKQLGADLRVIHGEVARAFLTHALQAHKTGSFSFPDWEDERYTLFPHDAEPAQGGQKKSARGIPQKDTHPQRQAKSRAGEAKKKSVSYVGIPADILGEIDALSAALNASKSDIMIYLLRYAIQQYQSGQFTLTPHPRPK